MSQVYRHLGIFSDWVEEAHRQQMLFPSAPPGPETQRQVREILGFCRGPELPLDVRVEDSWTRDGVSGEVVTWSVGYGPRTAGWVLKPEGAREPLPGLVALHDHGGFKFFGKEKIADGPASIAPGMEAYRARYYDGHAFANDLAREGFVVLVHDAFLWGSRRFPVEAMPENIVSAVAAAQGGQKEGDVHTLSEEIAFYNAASGHHEHIVAKYCNVLGTSLAGVVSREDRIAVAYLRSRLDVQARRVGCIGLSGGGNRAALLQATCDEVRAAVIVSLMSTYRELLDHNIGHTWLLYPPGWSRYGDWPDLAACRAPSPLLVQYNRGDALFTLKGMEEAHRCITGHYQSVGRPDAYQGQFYEGPHKFDVEMQKVAFDWLKQVL